MIKNFLEIQNIISTKKYYTFILLIFLSILTSLLELMSFTSLFLLIGSVFTDRINDFFLIKYIKFINFEISYILLTIFLIVILIKNIYISYWFNLIYGFNSSLLNDLRTRIFNLKFNNANNMIDNQSVSKSIRNISITAEDFVNYIIQPSITFFSEVFLIILVIIIFLYVDIDITIYSFTFLFFLSILMYLPVKNKFKEYANNRQINFNNFINLLNYIMLDFKVLDNLKRTNYFKNFFYQSSLDEAKGRKNFLFFREMPRQIFEIIISVFIVIFFLLIQNDDYYLEKLIFFGIVSIRLLPSFSRILSSISAFKVGTNSIEELKRDLLLDTSETKINKIKILNNEINSININNVSFKYEKSNFEIFKNIDLEFKKGKTYSIMGRSGVGKTTLLNLIMGFIKPDKGNILLNNKINYYDNTEQNILFGYLPQQINLFNSSILENIILSFDKSEYDKSKLENALLIADLKDFIDDLEGGIYYNVGDSGTNISIGQKQRIGIARIIYYGAPILIFDEGFSSLDEKTETKVFKQIDKLKKDKIVIFVTHDYELSQKCDYQLNIENKKIVINN